MSEYYAQIRGFDRRKEWIEVFGTDIVPILSPVAKRADLPGHPHALVYLMAIDELTPEQRSKQVDFLADKFRMTRREVAAEIATRGIPILADECTISEGRPEGKQ